MSFDLSPRAALTEEECLDLENSMREYYCSLPTSYYEIADTAASQYEPHLQPFHCDLASGVEPDASLLEMGCGTAHLCPHVEKHGGHYTGIDFDEELLEENRRRFPNARFLRVGETLNETFDLVASLYTIEHIVDPPAYLEQMWGYCRDGGLVAIICPEFVDRPTFLGSIYYGTTPRRFREKIRSLDFVDAFRHIVDAYWRAGSEKNRLQSSPAGSFWLNLKISELAGASHGIDTDAVHLARLKDLEWWLERRGAEVLTTSEVMADVPPEVLQYNCYIVGRKASIN